VSETKPQDPKPNEAPIDPVAAAAALAEFEADQAEPRMKPLAPPAAGKAPVVLFDKVTKSFDEFTAIKDVSFSIEDHPGRGEFVSILGPSGCGKSTVIRMIAGLTPQFPHTSGRILIDGKPVTGPGADRGMVFQDYSSFDNRSVRENIAFGLQCRGNWRPVATDAAVRKDGIVTITLSRPHGLAVDSPLVVRDMIDSSFDIEGRVDKIFSATAFGYKQSGKPDAVSGRGLVQSSGAKVSKAEIRDAVDHWIGKVGLSVKKDADKYPHELSGGMRQRVAIARTLILEPRIILMDEPFGALDPPTRSRMQDNLVELWREQSPTIFFITHSVEEAVFLGDHILMFSSSPGTVLQTLRVPPPDRPSLQMQRDPKFIEVVHGLRDVIEKLESSTRAGD
jgi:ABC-type nitrate/sulfonate/bicarbonate transport system ATPase subunit